MNSPGRPSLGYLVSGLHSVPNGVWIDSLQPPALYPKDACDHRPQPPSLIPTNSKHGTARGAATLPGSKPQDADIHEGAA